MLFFKKGVDNFEIEHKTCQFLVRGSVPPNSGVTGRGQSAPKTSDREISADPPVKERQGKKGKWSRKEGKSKRGRWKIEIGKVTK